MSESGSVGALADLDIFVMATAVPPGNLPQNGHSAPVES